MFPCIHPTSGRTLGGGVSGRVPVRTRAGSALAAFLSFHVVLSGQTPAPATRSADPLLLNPFEVTTGSDKSYGAATSNSVTAFSAELQKLPITADVFGETFLADAGLNTMEEVVQNFSAGAGFAAGSADSYAGNNQYLDRNAGTLSIRGLSAPSLQVNGFFPMGGGGANATGITSLHNTERVEVVSGPQSLLYGVSGSGGVVNTILKQANFDRAANGSFKYQVDQHGNKMGLLDYGAGTRRFAVRLALLNQSLGGRRVMIGGPLHGGYLQVAFKPVPGTVIRYSLDKTVFDRINPISNATTLTALSSANDVRNRQNLKWLLATNQVTAAAGASGAGPILGGKLDWDNVDALAGGMYGEFQRHTLHTLTVESRWNSWLSSQASAGYRTEDVRKVGNAGITFYAPNAGANPLGTWAVSGANGLTSAISRPVRQKVGRFSVLATNAFFGGRARSRTIAGVDFTRTDNSSHTLNFVLADGNFNPVKTGVAANNGYTLIPTVFWPVADGPVQTPLWNRYDDRVTYNGVNYVRQDTNASDPSRIGPGNPLGLTGTGAGGTSETADLQGGTYFANFTDWFDGRLSTLGGVRVGRAYLGRKVNATATPSNRDEVVVKYTGFNAGLSYAVRPWLNAYLQTSSNYVPPSNSGTDPYGNFVKISSGIGEEAGLKFGSAGGAVSGSIGVFRTRAKNEVIGNPTAVTSDINYPGLNGRVGVPNNSVNADRISRGVQLLLTAAPSRAWRLRFSAAAIDATLTTGKSFAQLYNDQFYANAQRQATYRDGTPVHVLTTATRVADAGTPGAVPLTLDMMNDPANRYFANPVPVAGAINPNSALATILRTVDPVRGPILTGAVGLPISAMQVAPDPQAPPPGNITVMNAGEKGVGFARYSANLTAMYTFPRGVLKGLRLGGTAVAKWGKSSYYYYPKTIAQPNHRDLFSFPDLVTVTGIAAYEFKLGRFPITTQVNVSNLLNHYRVVALPNYLNGWSGPNNATFDAQPRLYVWSTTVKF
jgi:outer membrane receptor protein involved in Fe transport